MGQTLLCVFSLLSPFTVFGKYVYVTTGLTWHSAQDYCREHYTEFALISGERDISLLRGLVDEDLYNVSFFWFGMKRSTTDSRRWTWSGGGEVSEFFWDDGQPDNVPFQDYGVLHRDKWYDANSNFILSFFCYRVFVVRERRTWEGAVRYCRRHHKDLASVASKEEMALILNELDKNETTGRVWIGLHFFPSNWHWTDGQPLSYEVWSSEGKPACPEVKFECAALKVKAVNRTNSTAAADINRSSYGNGLWYTTGGVEAEAEEVEESVWEAHDCEEKLNFVCY